MEAAKLDRRVRNGQFFLLVTHIVNGTNGPFPWEPRSGVSFG
jgi:hypothetical protein